MAAGLRVWRICKLRHAAAALSGEGTRLFAARWNPVGVRMVYTASSLSLALVETFVPLDASQEPGSLVSMEALLPVEEAAVARLEVKSLPKDWKRIDHPALQKLGQEWVRSGRSLALMAPSAVVRGSGMCW